MADNTNGVNGRSAPNGRASYAERHKPADHFIGGNRLSNAPSSKVKDFVAENDGHTVITNVSLPLDGQEPSEGCQCESCRILERGGADEI
jgi:acetyl-CoA carboxylase/biotin carboxylase 1